MQMKHVFHSQRLELEQASSKFHTTVQYTSIVRVCDLHDLQTVRKTVWIPLSVSGGPYHCNRQTENMTATLALALTELYSLFSHSFNFVPIRVVLTHMQRFIGAGCGLDSPSFQSINEPVNSDNLLSSCQPR